MASCQVRNSRLSKSHTDLEGKRALRTTSQEKAREAGGTVSKLRAYREGATVSTTQLSQ